MKNVLALKLLVMNVSYERLLLQRINENKKVKNSDIAKRHLDAIN